MKIILHAVHIHAEPSLVYTMLTTKHGLSRWWSTRVSMDELEGGLIEFTFVGPFNPQMQQTRLEADRRVEWLCVAGHENWHDNTFVFSIEPRDTETLLIFRQHYARELADETYGTYNFNWGYYLNSLKRLCETGMGTPYESPS